jgi:F0F1-type ATP synthase assembly protein I
MGRCILFEEPPLPYHRPIPGAKQTGKPAGIIGAWIQAEKLMQIALVLPCSVFIGWLAGAWLDHRLHQSWIAIAGLVFGGISGMVYVVRLVFAVNKDPAMQDEDSNESADNNKAGKGSAGSGS